MKIKIEIETPKLTQEAKDRIWQFVHNAIAHPMEGAAILLTGNCPKWIDRFHAYAIPKSWRNHTRKGAE